MQPGKDSSSHRFRVPARLRARTRRVAVAAALATVAVTGWVTIGQIGESAAVDLGDVPSYWNDVRMTCRTSKDLLAEDGRETFRCRSSGPGRPQPGRYDHTSTRWFSDVDGRRASEHLIVITPSGSVTGWATY